MFKRWLNQGSIVLKLSPRGPVLIKSGRETVDPSQPDMAFMRTRHPDVGDTVFFPGTGLKGALRAHAERLLRGAGVWVCDPLAKALSPTDAAHRPLCREAAGKRDGQDSPPTATVFRLQCPACRTFGSLAVSGHASVLDAYPWAVRADGEAMRKGAEVANRTERRIQVAIDRETGQSAQGGGLFEIEAVTGGTFETEIPFENLQLWQLALLFAVIQDLDAGDFGIGHGKARGLGRVRAEIAHFRFTSLRPTNGHAAPNPESKLFGAAALAPSPEIDAYGLLTPDVIDLPDDLKSTATWRGQALELDGDQARLLGDRLLEVTLAKAIPRLSGLRKANGASEGGARKP